jgi:hypothetical protein
MLKQWADRVTLERVKQRAGNQSERQSRAKGMMCLDVLKAEVRRARNMHAGHDVPGCAQGRGTKS